MNLSLRRASYFNEPIRSMRSLAAALRAEEAVIQSLASRASTLYRPVPPKPGLSRLVFDAKPPLKRLHKRIKTAILSHVRFPPYITGSVPGKDYKLNADLHKGRQLVICEDVKGFFPSISREAVFGIWREFFGFSADVAEVLTTLCTKDGALPQGAIPSSYLANLVLWRREPMLEAKLRAMGVTYSRYVDDISMSSATHLSNKEQTWLIAQVYGMLQSEGLRAGRGKHQIFSATKRMFVTKLMVNTKPGFIEAKRANIRTGVFQIERQIAAGDVSAATLAALTDIAQRVGQLGRFYPKQADALRIRVKAARAQAQKMLYPPVEAAQPVNVHVG